MSEEPQSVLSGATQLTHLLSSLHFISYEQELVHSHLTNSFTQVGSGLGTLMFTAEEQAMIRSSLDNPPAPNSALIDAFSRRI
ncbi:MAG: hypothetical protein H0U23_05670 [Blastocatellia bacterium]|nr:hypothetical protein [Blastocatellia bacterium]